MCDWLGLGPAWLVGDRLLSGLKDCPHRSMEIQSRSVISLPIGCVPQKSHAYFIDILVVVIVLFFGCL